PEGLSGETIQYEEPVAFVRMVAPDLTVRNTVNGWPAALSREYGQGRVLITTLAPRGWIKPAGAANGGTSENQLGEQAPGFVVLSPMEDLAAHILAKREPDPILQSDLESIAQEYVAYSVPTFGLIAGTMGVFLA